MSPGIDGMIEHGCVTIRTICIVRRRCPPQCIVIVAILIIVRVSAECCVKPVQHSSLICCCARKMIMIRHCRERIPRLPIANSIKVGCGCIQFGSDLVDTSLGNSDVLSFGFVVTEFLCTWSTSRAV